MSAATWKCANCGAVSADSCIANGCAMCEREAPAIQQEGAALDERVCLLDVVSHHSDFVAACHYRREACIKEGDTGNAAYWAHQIATLNRMADQARAAVAAPAPVQPTRGDALSQQAEDSRLLDWLEENCATLTRLHDNSGYILSVNGLARGTGKTARAALLAQAPAPVQPKPPADSAQGDDRSVHAESPPEFYKYNPSGLEGMGDRSMLWDYGQLVGWRSGMQQGRAAGIEEAAQSMELLCYGMDHGGGGTAAERLRQAQRGIRALNKQEPKA